MHHEHLNQYFQNLFDKFLKQEFVDFYFEFPTNERIGVHSVVLAAQSDVFNAMLTGPLQEDFSVTIKDISFSTFKKLIHEMYFMVADLETLEEAFELYGAAHKYNCALVMEHTRDRIYDDFLSISSAGDIYHFANFYGDKTLEKYCVDIYHEKIRKFLKKFKTSTEFLGEPTPDLKSYSVKIQGILTDIASSSDIEKVVTDSLDLVQGLVDAIYDTTRKVFLDEENQFKIELKFDKMPKRYNSPLVVVTKYTNLLPQTYLTNNMEIVGGTILFKFVNEENPRAIWILVHKNIIREESNVLANLVLNSGTEYELNNISVDTFRKIIDLMYNLPILLATCEETFAFYELSKKLNFQRGVEFSRYIFSCFLSIKDIEKIYKFGKFWNDQLIMDDILWFFSNKMDSRIRKIFKQESKKEAKKDFKEKIFEYLENVLTKSDIQDKMVCGVAYLKILLEALYSVISRIFQFQSFQMTLGWETDVKIDFNTSYESSW